MIQVVINLCGKESEKSTFENATNRFQVPFKLVKEE
jgi:hypothetical protein